MNTRTIVFLTTMACVALASDLRAGTLSASEMITPDQRDRIKQHILHENRPSVAAPDGFTAAVGVQVPAGIELFWMPPEAGVNRYRYTIIENRAMILDYEHRRVIEFVE